MELMKKKIRLIRESAWGIICLYMIIVMQFIFIAYVNITRIPITMDNDSAKLFLHIAEMCRNNTIFIPNWSNMTTLEIDCSSIFALPLYYIIKNIYLSFGISNMIILACYMLIIGAILKNMQVKKYARLICYILLMVPYSFGQLLYFNMMFFAGGQYSVKVLMPLLMVYLMICNNASKGTKWYIVAFVTCLMGFICGVSSGPYVLITGIMPVVLCFYLLLFTEGRGGYAVICDEERDFSDDRSRGIISVVLSRKSLFGLLMIISSMLGIVICHLKNVNTTGLSMKIVTNDKLVQSLESFVASFWELFGATAYDDVNVLSISGVTYAVRFGFVLLAIFVLIISVRYMYRELMYNRKNHDVKRNIYICLAMIIVINIFVVIVTGAGNEARYQLVSVVPLLMLICVWVNDHLELTHGTYEDSGLSSDSEIKAGDVVIKKRPYGKSDVVVLAIAAILLIITALSDWQVMSDMCYPLTASENAKSVELCKVLRDCDESVVVLFDDTAEAEILRMMDYESGKLYIAYKEATDEYSEAGLGVHDYYTNIVTDDLMSNPHLVIVNEFITDIDRFEMIVGNTYERLGEYQNYKIYRFIVK